MEKTRNYDQFKFREDNRKIDWSHVEKIKDSIRMKNLLEFRPMEVNSKMEIMDGQHRLMAAKDLGVEIYYKIVEDMKPQDIILIQTAKAWKMPEFLAYYLYHGYQEYIKLDEFIKKNKISLQMALVLSGGKGDNHFHDFKMGKYVFQINEFGEHLDLIHQTCDYIRRINGNVVSQYTNSARFWKALIVIMKHPNFNQEKWFKNLGIHVTKFRPLATFKDYLKLSIDVFNYKNLNKISLGESENYE